MKKVMFLLGVLLFAGRAEAFLDLTTLGSSGTINSARFEQLNTSSTGTGSINSFVRISSVANATVEEGYNTSGRPLQFGQNDTLQFTHDLLLSDVPVVTLSNINYYQFLLDVNEPGSAAGKYISLDSLKIYTSLVGGLTPANPDSLGTLVYNMDTGTDTYIKLDATLNSGSGSGDMFAYIPTASFSGTYVYLYSKFGTDFGATGGFEEWATLKGARTTLPTNSVPEPATMALMTMGFAGLGLRRKKK